MRNTLALVALALPTCVFAQSFTEHTSPMVLPTVGTVYETGAGSPTVTWDPTNNEFVMFFESHFGNFGDTPGCARAGDVLWGISRATSPDGLSWTVDTNPVLEPAPGSYYGCALVHPDVVYDGTTWHLFFNAYQEDTACDVNTPAWGCYEQVGVGHATSPDGVNWAVDPAPAVVVADAFGFPTVAVLDNEWTMLLSNNQALSRATAPDAAGPWTWDPTPVLSPTSLISSMEDEVFESNLVCEDYQPVELYFGGYNRDDANPVTGALWETSMLYATSTNSGLDWSIDIDPAVNPLMLWDNLAGDTSWRHWDAVRVGGQTLIYYAINLGNGNEIHLAYTGADTNFDTSTFTDNICWTENLPGSAVDDAYVLAEDTTLVVAAGGVLINDTDREGNGLTAIVDTDASSGTLLLNADGSFEYTPDANFNGFDSFSYAVDDGTSASRTAIVTLEVTPANDAPYGIDQVYQAVENVTLFVDAANGLLVGAGDIDGDAITAEMGVAATFGTLNFSTTGAFDYTATSQDCGTAEFGFYVDDSTTQSGPYTATIEVLCVNDAPMGTDDLYVTAEDTPLVIGAPGVLDNDSDPEGDPLTAVLVSTTVNGTLVLLSDGSFDYTPDPLYNGPDSFTYVATDGPLDSVPITVTLDITSVPNPPVGTDDAYALDEDSTLMVADVDGVLANDVDPEGDELTATIIDVPTNGVLAFDQLNVYGGFEYTPNADYTGADRFTYEVTDATGQTTGPYTAWLDVLPINDAPVGLDDAYVTEYGVPLPIDAAAGLLSNDSDIDGDDLVAAVVTAPIGGDLDLEPTDGSFLYTPNDDFSGTDRFTYQVFDGTTQSADVQVTIEVGDDPNPGTETTDTDTAPTTDTTPTTGLNDTGGDDGGKGCGCDAGTGPTGLFGSLFLGLIGLRRRR